LLGMWRTGGARQLLNALQRPPVERVLTPVNLRDPLIIRQFRAQPQTKELSCIVRWFHVYPAIFFERPD
jgi:hypothetical protein